MKIRVKTPRRLPPKAEAIDYPEIISQINRELEHHGLSALDLLSSFALHLLGVALDVTPQHPVSQQKVYRDLHLEISRMVGEALDRKQRLLGSPLGNQSLPKERD